MINREDSESIAVIRMAHGKVSALDALFCDALVKEITEVARGPARALVLTGTGSSFSAGVDLFQALEGGADYLIRFLPAMETFFRTLLTFPKPAVAAVNGHAIAGGCIIAAACDHRIMVNGTGRIGVPELAVGVPFPTLPFEIVGARVPQARFRDLVYSGRVVLPPEALALNAAGLMTCGFWNVLCASIAAEVSTLPVAPLAFVPAALTATSTALCGSVLTSDT